MTAAPELFHCWAGAIPIGAMRYVAQAPRTDVRLPRENVSRDELIAFVRDNPWCSASDIAKPLKREARDICSLLTKYAKLGLIERKGARKKYLYRVLPPTS